MLWSLFPLIINAGARSLALACEFLLINYNFFVILLNAFRLKQPLRMLLDLKIICLSAVQHVGFVRCRDVDV